jgi:hypothetical protein
MRIIEVPVEYMQDGPDSTPIGILYEDCRCVAMSLEGLISAINYDEVDTENCYLYIDNEQGLDTKL